MRCKGRLEYFELQPDAKEPIILPKGHHLTTVQIRECHARVLHSGVRNTLAELRSRFWVPKGRQAVKQVLNRCVLCKKMGGKSFRVPPAARLADFRVNTAPSFSKTGVDFTGPLFVNRVVKGLCVTRVLSKNSRVTRESSSNIGVIREFVV